MNRLLPLFVVALAAVLLLADPAAAGLGAWMSGLATRSRGIQVCMVVMLLALFIMMKKLSDR